MSFGLHKPFHVYNYIFTQMVGNMGQVANALLQLRQRNKYQDNAVPPWYRLSPQGHFLLGSPDVADASEICPFDPAPALAEMSVLARNHARLMVTTAVKVCYDFSDYRICFSGLKSLLKVIKNDNHEKTMHVTHSKQEPVAQVGRHTFRHSSNSLYIDPGCM